MTSSRICSILGRAPLDQVTIPVGSWEWRALVHSYCWPRVWPRGGRCNCTPLPPNPYLLDQYLGSITQVSLDFLSFYSCHSQSLQHWITKKEQLFNLSLLFHRHQCECIKLWWETITLLWLVFWFHFLSLLLPVLCCLQHTKNIVSPVEGSAFIAGNYKVFLSYEKSKLNQTKNKSYLSISPFVNMIFFFSFKCTKIL